MISRAIALIVILSVYLIWIFSGTHVASDLPYLSKEDLNTQFNLPLVWVSNGNFGLGEYFVWGLASWPINFLFGLFNQIGFDFNFLLNTFWIGLYGSVIWFGIFKLCKIYNFSELGKWTSLLVYSCNSYIILLIDGGQLNLVLAYAGVPLVFASYKSMFSDPSRKNFLMWIVSIFLLSIFDVRILFIVGLLILMDLTYVVLINKKIDNLAKLSIQFICSGLILLSLHSYWLLPSIIYKVPDVPFTQTNIDQLINLSFTTIGHGLLLQHPNWYQNIFGRVSNFRWEFFIFPGMAFAFFIFSKKTHLFWVVVALVGIFLSKGTNPPLGEINSFLFVNLPGFSFFRDSSKFFIIICLAYSLLIGDFIQKIQEVKIFNLKKYFFNLIMIFFLGIFLITLSPVYLRQMNGMFNFPIQVEKYQRMNDLIKYNEGYSKILWIPLRPALGYSSPDHPAIEADRLADIRPFSFFRKGSYERLNFLREGQAMGAILDVLGVSHIAFTEIDPRKDDLHPDAVRYHNLFIDQINNLDWVEKKDVSILPVIATKKHQDLFFLASRLWAIVGSESVYNQTLNDTQLALTDNVIIFLEEKVGLVNHLPSYEQTSYLLNNKENLDLAATFIDKEEIIFPADFLSLSPDTSGWWKRNSNDFVKFRTFLNEKYSLDLKDFDFGGGWAISEGRNLLNIKINRQNQQYVLLARIYESSKSGQIKVEQNKKLIGELETRQDKQEFHWYEIGNINSQDPLNITTSGEINIINALALVELEKWKVIKKQLGSFTISNNLSTMGMDQEQSLTGKIQYKKINSTKYILSVTDLTSPKILIFSQKFDPLWKLNGQSPFPAYNLINGFTINKDGDYTLEYTAQKAIVPGLSISILTIVLLIGWYLYPFRKKIKI